MFDAHQALFFTVEGIHPTVYIMLSLSTLCF